MNIYSESLFSIIMGYREEWGGVHIVYMKGFPFRSVNWDIMQHQHSKVYPENDMTTNFCSDHAIDILEGGRAVGVQKVGTSCTIPKP